MDVNDAMRVCFKNNIKVYPHKRKIHVAELNKPTIVYEKELTSPKDINKAMELTYIYHAKKITTL
tara:strand:+ start:2608 stop:2802 length:195 start_codon:yes stop_codon:yes gene_type:complete